MRPKPVFKSEERDEFDGVETSPPASDPRAVRFEVGGQEFAILSLPAECPTFPVELTDAERSVVMLVLGGASNAQVARRRGTSPRTIANQLAGIFEKLGVHSRSELAARCAGEAHRAHAVTGGKG